MASQHSRLLEAIMDRMIPAVGDLPSAGQMGLIDEIVELAAKQKRFEDLFHSAITAFESGLIKSSVIVVNVLGGQLEISFLKSINSISNGK